MGNAPASIYWDAVPRPTSAILAGLVATVLATAQALLIGPVSAGSAGRRQLVSGVFVLLLPMGMVDLIYHVGIPEPPRKAPPAHTLGKFVEAVKNESFRNWLFAAVGLSAQQEQVAGHCSGELKRLQ